jgi:hypothetical protein
MKLRIWLNLGLVDIKATFREQVKGQVSAFLV